VAMLLPGRRDAVEWELANEPAAVKRLAKRLLREAVGELRVCHEAGPCGYTLQRQLRAANVDSIVVAPSLVPVKPSEGSRPTAATRHGILHPGTRALRGRCLPTKNGHAGSARARARVIREYQSDSSSKRPGPSSVLRSWPSAGKRKDAQ
jgi:transposase